MADHYDVLIIGGGPGGYVAAIRAAQLGFKTACVEDRVSDTGKPVMGGTCLNVGCIPSKALLDSSHHFEHLQKGAAAHGIIAPDVSIDVAKMMARKDRIVQILTQGIAGLLQKNKIDWLRGHGQFTGPGTVRITPAEDQAAEDLAPMTVSAEHIIIATGSVPMAIPPAQVDGKRIVDSTGALEFLEVPKRLGIIGAGVIGLELGSVWRRLGAEVVILEALPDLLPTADTDIASAALRVLRKQGLDIRLGAMVTGSETSEHGVTAHFKFEGKPESLKFDQLIVAVGRRPNTAGLGADVVGLKLDERGFIEVDSHCQTNIENVYAIGDVVRGPMLAHKASEEGVAVAERIAGQASEIDHSLIPWVIYTWPEIAWVGATEAALTRAGRAVKTGNFPFMASGRARAMGEREGFVKVISDALSDEILGVHIFGPNASELVAEAVMAMEFGASSEDIARTCHAHPTLSEALHEAALAADGRAIHF